VPLTLGTKVNYICCYCLRHCGNLLTHMCVWERNRHILPNSRRIPCDKESGIDLSMCWKCLDYSKCCRKRSRGPWGILCRRIIFRQHDEQKEIILISSVSEGGKNMTKPFSISLPYKMSSERKAWRHGCKRRRIQFILQHFPACFSEFCCGLNMSTRCE